MSGLKRFTCVQCGGVSLVTGGTSCFRCAACRSAAGESESQRLQRAAHAAVANAIRTGLLPHPSACGCVDCGNGAAQYDHRDYSKPLDVQPVCRSCNVRRGPAIGHPIWGGPWSRRKAMALSAKA